MTVAITYQILLVVQAIHLLHHRIAKRHISYVEGITALVLCIPPAAVVSNEDLSIGLMVVHCALISIQVVGSIFIKRLSPDHFEASL